MGVFADRGVYQRQADRAVQPSFERGEVVLGAESGVQQTNSRVRRRLVHR
jgi:hypothetical protein